MIVLLATAALGGAWTREAGDHYAKIGADLYAASDYVDPLTGMPADRRYLGQQYGVYGEIGVLRAWPVQLTVQAPLSIGTVAFAAAGYDGRARATTVRLGDAHLAVQAKLPVDAVQLAAALDAKVPLYANGAIGQDYPVYQGLFPKVGDGQVDLTAWLLAGGAVPHGWLEGGLGYRHRTEAFVGWDVDLQFVDGIALTATAGAQLGPVAAMLKADGVKNLTRDELTREYLTAGPALLWTISGGVGLEARFAADLWARHAARGVGGGIGVSVRRPS